jgi:hypothetical protein
MTEQSLFPESIEERRQTIDAQIEWLLFGKPGGPLGLTLSNDEKRVLTAIRYRRGAVNAISIADMREAMGRTAAGALTDREVKKIVRSLRVQFHLPIGSSKFGSNGGYFVMLTDKDHAILHSQVLDQVRAELEVLKAVDGPRAALELLGQLQLEVGVTAQ